MTAGAVSPTMACAEANRSSSPMAGTSGAGMADPVARSESSSPGSNTSSPETGVEGSSASWLSTFERRAAKCSTVLTS